VNVDVDVEVRVGGDRPGSTSRRRHVVEAGREAPSGRLVWAARTTCPTPPGPPYRRGGSRLRGAEAELGADVDSDDSDEFEETMERTRIDVWPAAFAPVQVLKQCEPWNTYRSD
jgi:hypothetical protein